MGKQILTTEIIYQNVKFHPSHNNIFVFKDKKDSTYGIQSKEWKQMGKKREREKKISLDSTPKSRVAYASNYNAAAVDAIATHCMKHMKEQKATLEMQFYTFAF